MPAEPGGPVGFAVPPGRRHPVGAAREVRKHLLRVFNLTADRELSPSNPIYALKRAG